MTHLRLEWLLVLALASPSLRAQTPSRSAAAPPSPQTLQPPAGAPSGQALTMDPAPEPDPALKYRLRPHFIDQNPGNAAQAYHMAVQLYMDNARTDDEDKVGKWLELPPVELPVAEVREMLDRQSYAIKQARIAARRERCDWQYPIRSEGYDLPLPNLGRYRNIAKLFALKARLEVANKQFDEADDDLQTGFGMARHACDSPLLISDLVGHAVGRVMARQVLAWIQAPNSPNLYWALSDLPSPMKDPRELLSGEEAMLYFAFPQLRNINAKSGPEDWNQVAAEVNRLIGGRAGDGPDGEKGWQQKLRIAGSALKSYPEAKQELIRSGQDPKRVEAMPVQQVILMAAHHEYLHHRDEIDKWFCVPYWQAREGLAQAEQSRRAGGLMKGYPFTMLLPSVSHAYYITTEFNCDIAALRCVEAIRMHAAANNGSLPASLDAITAVPLPINPMTGKPFDYQLSDNRAVLTAVAPAGEPYSDKARWVITIRQH